jgi:hypothetical protein
MSNADWLAKLKRELQHFCSDGNSCSFGGPASPLELVLRSSVQSMLG